ncbi:MAG TPA: pentapeptide repeat-containing protein [Solirubrobacteraceae bacterium]
MSEEENKAPLTAPAQGIRDAAKYLIAAFGAIGAVLVANLSLTALPSGAHPLIAALAVGVAVLALAILVGMGVSVLTPKAVTLGKLAQEPNSPVVKRLKDDEALFQGQGSDLVAFHKAYVEALTDRATAQDEYLKKVEPTTETKSRIADARVEFLDQAVSQVLEVAVFYQLQERFSVCRRTMMTALALIVVAAAGVFAWASAKPTSAHSFLRGAVLTDDDLQGVNLEGADLREVDLGGTNLKGANVAKVKSDDKTIWVSVVCPDGTMSVGSENGCEGHLSP